MRLSTQALSRLANYFTALGLPRAAKECKRGTTRPGRRIQLTATEFHAIYDAPLTPALRGAIDDVAPQLASAEAFEQLRDERVKPQLEARRRKMQELNAA